MECESILLNQKCVITGFFKSYICVYVYICTDYFFFHGFILLLDVSFDYLCFYHRLI